MTRKGGIGVAAGISVIFFLMYWEFLMGGEKLADRGLLTAFWGLWALWDSLGRSWKSLGGTRGGVWEALWEAAVAWVAQGWSWEASWSDSGRQLGGSQGGCWGWGGPGVPEAGWATKGDTPPQLSSKVLFCWLTLPGGFEGRCDFVPIFAIF